MDTNANQPQKTQLSSPMTKPHKEQEPVASGASEQLIPSEQEPVVTPEASEIGVETVSEMPSLTPEHEKIGVTRAKEAMPVSTEPSGIVQLPISVPVANQIIKTNGNTEDSEIWYAWLIKKVAQKLGLAA